MPRSHLTKKGRAVQGSFTRRYGKRGKAVFYARMNKVKSSMARKLTKKGSMARKAAARRARKRTRRRRR